MKFLIRNDDVSFDTKISEIKQFCEICDRYGFQIIQAIMPIGEARKLKKSRKMTNDQIVATSHNMFSQNSEVLQYLRSRNDLIGVHGLWHTHSPTPEEIDAAKFILEGLGFSPTYFVPPFNEGHYDKEICGLTLCQLSADRGESLENFLQSGTPKAPIMYLHSWRFDNDWYTFDMLEKTLKRLTNE